MHRTLSWRNHLYIYLKKTKLSGSASSLLYCHFICRRQCGERTIQNSGYKKKAKERSGKDRYHLKNPQTPAWLKKIAFSLPSVYSTVQCFSDTFSPSPGRSRTTWKRTEENAPPFIMEKPHTLPHLKMMCIVLQGWEHSTSVSLCHECPYKMLKLAEVHIVSPLKHKLSSSILPFGPLLAQVFCYETSAGAFSSFSFCVTICRYFSRMGGSCS